MHQSEPFQIEKQHPALHRTSTMGKKVLYIAAVVTAAIAFGIGIIIGHFAIHKSTPSNTDYKYDRLTRQADPQTYKTFIDSILAKNIEDNLRDLTSRPHMAGLPEDLESARVIEDRWKTDGLQVFKPRYNVLLSYPDNVTLNRVSLKRSDGSVIFQTNGTEKVYDPSQAKTVNPFLAYTPNGANASTRLYYANYGQLEDLQALASKVGNASLNGSIIIIRYGRIYRGDKVINAQEYGAVGVILYNDPADYAPLGITPNQTFDAKWYMPPSGAQRGSAFIGSGDPLTPIYPSTDYMFRVKEELVRSLPRIPAQPIGYEEAAVFLRHMPGEEVINQWRGTLPNILYRYGGELLNASLVEVTSYNRRERRDTYNVIGIMKGDIEPDRYVVIGNHRDAWSLGSIDPTSGTAALLEMTRVLGDMYRNGFRPRRSLMFCSWGAEEYGLIGSVEYVQEYVKVLGARIVSYLNLDPAVEGNYTIHARASPMLADVIIEISKMIPSAYDPPGMTVYDKWMKVNRNNVTNEPKIQYGLGSGSDYYAFDQLVGSSNFDASYGYDPNAHGNVDYYPLYHTSYETFSTVKKFIDPDFSAHRTMCQFVGVLVLFLSESLILPFQVTRYASVLQGAMKTFPVNNSQFEILRMAIDEFDRAAQDFHLRSKSMDTSNSYEIRAYNDQLLQVERAFLNPLGQGAEYTDYKHIIYAPAKGNQYDASGFPAITDAMAAGNQTDIDQQIAIVTYFIRGAASALKTFCQFMFS